MTEPTHVSATLSLNRERAGHYTLAVVIDRLSLLCRPQNKYSRECCQPESLSDRVRYLISFPRSHISPYYMLDCFRNCCCGESGFIGKCKKCDSLSAAAHCLIISLVFLQRKSRVWQKFSQKQLQYKPLIPEESTSWSLHHPHVGPSLKMQGAKCCLNPQDCGLKGQFAPKIKNTHFSSHLQEVKNFIYSTIQDQRPHKVLHRENNA